MPKRIHKKEGSLAWRKAMNKSMNRMARDSVKIQAKGNYSEAIARQAEVVSKYLKNKTSAQKHFWIDKWDIAFRRATAKDLPALKKMWSLTEQAEVLNKGIKKSMEPLNKRSLGQLSKQELLRLKSGIELYAGKIENWITQMNEITNPITRQLKTSYIKLMRQELTNFSARLAEIDRAIEEVK